MSSRRPPSYLDQIDYSGRDDETESIASTARKMKDPVKKAWCQTQWTNLSHQAVKLNLPHVYFDTDTMLLDKVTNKKLWQLLSRLYDLLGPDKAPYACPAMQEGGAVEWHNYADGCKGIVAEVVEEIER